MLHREQAELHAQEQALNEEKAAHMKEPSVDTTSKVDPTRTVKTPMPSRLFPKDQDESLESDSTATGGKDEMRTFLHNVRKQAELTPVGNDTDDDDDFDDISTDAETDTKLPTKSPLHHRRSIKSPSGQPFTSPAGRGSVKMSMEDIEICQRLDDEYERALEEREVGYNARYASVRQSAFLSVFFMFTYLFLGTLFFMRQAAWTIPDSLLFSIYTITTVGYGNSSGAPTTPGFQAYIIFYILIGIAALTIVVS